MQDFFFMRKLTLKKCMAVKLNNSLLASISNESWPPGGSWSSPKKIFMMYIHIFLNEDYILHWVCKKNQNNMTFDLGLHDQTAIGFFLSLWASHIPRLELIAWFFLELWYGNRISIFINNHEWPLTLTYMTQNK